MEHPMYLHHLSINREVLIDQAALAVTEFSGRRYHCPRIFPLEWLVRLQFAAPAPPEPCYQALRRHWEAQQLLVWDIRFSGLPAFQDPGYLLWCHWGDTAVALEVGTPLPGSGA